MTRLMEPTWGHSHIKNSPLRPQYITISPKLIESEKYEWDEEAEEPLLIKRSR